MSLAEGFFVPVGENTQRQVLTPPQIDVTNNNKRKIPAGLVVRVRLTAGLSSFG